MLSITGKKAERVLPYPVGAFIITFFPDFINGIDNSCTFVNSEKPSSVKTLLSFLLSNGVSMLLY